MRSYCLALATVSLILSGSLYSAPFYKVQCYDANDKLVNCNDVVTAKKSIAKVRKTIKKKPAGETLAQKEARERAIALREIAKQNEELKAEMQALREATLLASAKTAETPATTAQLAPQTTMAVPAPISKAEVAKETSDESKSPFSGGLSNEVSKSFKSDTPLSNELSAWISYEVDENISLELSNYMGWNWNVPSGKKDHSFKFGDLNARFYYNGVYVSPNEQTKLNSRIQLTVPTTSSSRDTGMILAVQFRTRLDTKFNSGKGTFRLENTVTPNFHRFSSENNPTGKSENPFSFNDKDYERLNPNTRFKLGFLTMANHKLTSDLTLEAEVSISANYTYAAEMIDGDTNTLVTTSPAAWVNSLAITFPKLTLAITDSFNFQGKVQTKTNLAEFKLYNVDSAVKGSDTAVYMTLEYSI